MWMKYVTLETDQEDSLTVVEVEGRSVVVEGVWQGKAVVHGENGLIL